MGGDKMKFSKAQKTEVNLFEKPNRYNFHTFYNSIKGWSLTQEQQEEAIQWFWVISLDQYLDFKDLLEDFYILYFDYIIFKNQNTLTGYKLKEMQEKIESIRKSGVQPYRRVKKESKDIIWDSYCKLGMKYDNFAEMAGFVYSNPEENRKGNLQEKREEITNNVEYSLDTISDGMKFMNILRKYSKEERYIW